jgi:hypothetical protein
MVLNTLKRKEHFVDGGTSVSVYCSVVTGRNECCFGSVFATWHPRAAVSEMHLIVWDAEQAALLRSAAGDGMLLYTVYCSALRFHDSSLG